jgi:hypothetical protein
VGLLDKNLRLSTYIAIKYLAPLSASLLRYHMCAREQHSLKAFLLFLTDPLIRILDGGKGSVEWPTTASNGWRKMRAKQAAQKKTGKVHTMLIKDQLEACY